LRCSFTLKPTRSRYSFLLKSGAYKTLVEIGNISDSVRISGGPSAIDLLLVAPAQLGGQQA
jgi:hypothetical protein